MSDKKEKVKVKIVQSCKGEASETLYPGSVLTVDKKIAAILVGTKKAVLADPKEKEVKVSREDYVDLQEIRAEKKAVADKAAKAERAKRREELRKQVEKEEVEAGA